MASKRHNSEKSASVSIGFAQFFLRKLQEILDRKNQNLCTRIYIKELEPVYAYEISCMMHILGDVAEPLEKSVEYLEAILRDQMNLLLIEASEVPSSGALSHAQLLTLIAHDRKKMTRLLHYLFLKDSSEFLGRKKYEQFIDAVSSSQFNVRVKTCLDFLSNIDAGGYDPETIKTGSDDVALERIARRFQMSSKMTGDQYLEFSKRQRICFYPKGDGGKFKDWLLADKVTLLQPTPLALDILSFFARETVAEVVEASLVIDRPKPKTPSKSVSSSPLKNNSKSKTNQPEAPPDLDLSVPSAFPGVPGLNNIIADESGSTSNIGSLVNAGSLGTPDFLPPSISSLAEKGEVSPTKASPRSNKKRKKDTADSDSENHPRTLVMGENGDARASTRVSDLPEPKIPARDADDPITVEDLKTALINTILSSPGKLHMRKKKKILCIQ